MHLAQSSFLATKSNKSAMAEDKKLKVRASGIRVAQDDKVGTVYDLKNPNEVKVLWDAKEAG